MKRKQHHAEFAEPIFYGNDHFIKLVSTLQIVTKNEEGLADVIILYKSLSRTSYFKSFNCMKNKI